MEEAISDDITSCEDHDSIAKLGNDVSKKIHMNDESNKNDTEGLHKWTFKDEEDDEEEEDDDLSEDELLSQMGYAKPESRRGFEEVEGEEENNRLCEESHNAQMTDRAVESSQHQPVIASSSPLVSNLISALKGSRPKQGRPPLELHVSWAPDVYDPVPTSPDQFASKNSDYEQEFVVGPKKCRGKGVREIEEGCYVGEKGTFHRGNRFNKGDILRSAKGSRKEKDKKQVKRHGRDKKYSSYSNYEDD